MATDRPKLPEIHFDAGTGQYWLRLENGRYLELSARDCKLHMQDAGLDLDMQNTKGLKLGEVQILDAQKNHYIDYAGALAGRRAGFFITPSGKRILVTMEASPIEPKRGKFEGIENFLGDLLGREQLPYFLCWLHVALDALRRGVNRPGQLVAFIGPPGCGKSFCHVLITRLLGGRSGKPYRYMTGQTTFNNELAEAEHLVIEDESAKINISARRDFGTAIKDWTVNEEISVHAKGRKAVMLSFFRRLSLSINGEAEDVIILPPLVSGVADKIMAFKCSPARLSENREKNIAMLTAELPGFAYMLSKYSVPKALRDPRFGVRAYHHPEILEMLGELSPEGRLESLIDEIIFPNENAPPFRGTAEQLEKEMRSSAFSYAVDKLMSFSAAMGTYLARLEKKNPERYQKRKNNGRTVWLIKKGKYEDKEKGGSA